MKVKIQGVRLDEDVACSLKPLKFGPGSVNFFPIFGL